MAVMKVLWRTCRKERLEGTNHSHMKEAVEEKVQKLEYSCPSLQSSRCPTTMGTVMGTKPGRECRLAFFVYLTQQDSLNEVGLWQTCQWGIVLIVN